MGKRLKCGFLSEYFYFLDMDERNMQMGGGERYEFELVKLLKQMDIDVDVYQFSYEGITTTTKFKNMRIKPLGNVRKNGDFEQDSKIGIEKFYEQTKDCDFYIFLTMNLAYQGKTPKPTISISHGIYWDFVNEAYKQPEWNQRVSRWLRNVNTIVSVDTNTINFVRANMPQYVDKMNLISNFCDQTIYKPSEKKDKSKFTVLYPRRINELRGIQLFLKSAEDLTQKYDDIEFWVVGKGLGDVEQKVKNWCKAQRNCRHDSYDMSSMHLVYPQADLSVIPTLASEGTSLAAIESISCGIPLISTDVGGLNDICIDDVNGIKIKANNQEQLNNAIEYAYLNRDKVNEWGKNALTISQAFSKEKWDAKWIKLINNFTKDLI